MTDQDKWKATRLVEGGRRKEWQQRLINVPVHRGSTLLFESCADLLAAKPGPGAHYYGLHGTPTQWALSEALTGLEPGAVGTCLYPSGLASVTAALLTVLRAGQQLLVPDSIYGPTRRFCDNHLARFGVETIYYPPTASADDLAALAGDDTGAIMLESPGSMTMEVQDVPGICAMARARGIATILDNTWATPLLFPALEHGVDISAMALTKFVGGHGDLIAGCASAGPEWFERLQTASWDLGFALSPDDAWLAARGLRTMGLRMCHQEASTLAIAEWLSGEARVGLMLHPAFASCPGHEYWKRDFGGSSSLFSFEFLGSPAERARFIDGLKHFSIGFSWGGYESLATPVDPVRTIGPAPATNLVRLQIGLEEPGDLIADLDQAFAALR
ncbi:MAG: cystathionine beta-lyase [Sphingomicrobium sp.]